LSIPIITGGEFTLLTTLIRRNSGITIGIEKKYFIESRLGPLVKKYNCSDYTGLYNACRDNKSGTIIDEIIDAVTVNETSFFRDKKPFDLIKNKLVPDLLGEKPGRPVNIWCAACSTGQEVYSITMVLKEILFDFSKYRIKILGTDISDTALAHASKGEYNTFDVSRGLSPVQISKNFFIVNDNYRIKDELRSIVQFSKHNLCGPIKIPGRFDIVLCRNVAIYFPKEKKSLLFNSIADILNPGGILIIGSTEFLNYAGNRFKRMEYHNAIYYTLC